MTVSLTAVSLFAGVGGIDLALERADVAVVAAVEIDNAARGVLAGRFPDTTLFRDVTEVTADDLRRAGFVPERGILTAGWPCQGNSVAGRHGGMADPRSGLWRHVVRLLAETRARWFLGENVPGLLSINGGDDIAVVRRDLAQLGYWWAERILDAQHFGVPQRRRRVFFVGHLADARRPVEVLLEPEVGGRDSAAGIALGQEVAATLTAGVAQPGGSAPGRRKDDVNLVVSTLTAHAGNGIDVEAAAGGHLIDVSATGETAHALTSEGADASEDGTGRGTPVIAFAWQAGASPSAALEVEMSPTLIRSQTMAIQTETTVRRLTPLECERLQGFPDDWTATSNGKPQADSPRYRQMGNAVPVPCVEWIVRRIVASEVTA